MAVDFDVVDRRQRIRRRGHRVPPGRRRAPRCSCSNAAGAGTRRTFRASRPIRGSGTTAASSKRHGWFDFRRLPQHERRAGRRRRRRVARLRQHLDRREARTRSTQGWPPEITFDDAAGRTTRRSTHMLKSSAVPEDAVARAHEAAEGRPPSGPATATGSARSSSRSDSTRTGPTICRTRTITRTARSASTSRASSRARASTSATATSAATSTRATRST